MAWMSSSQPTPAALTTPLCLRWCSASPWTTDSMTPTPVWWGKGYQSSGSLILLHCDPTFYQCWSILTSLVCLFCRVGSVQARCLSWMSTVLVMVCGGVTDTCVTWVTCWRGQRTGLWLTPPCCTTALPSVPHTSTATGTENWHTALLLCYPPSFLSLSLSVSRSVFCVCHKCYACYAYESKPRIPVQRSHSTTNLLFHSEKTLTQCVFHPTSYVCCISQSLLSLIFFFQSLFFSQLWF